jgi:tRNA/tmRNA/rRNA uracil-C5-methylase (TrmA/RlmC/RlmD family)
MIVDQKVADAVANALANALENGFDFIGETAEAIAVAVWRNYRRYMSQYT